MAALNGKKEVFHYTVFPKKPATWGWGTLEKEEGTQGGQGVLRAARVFLYNVCHRRPPRATFMARSVQHSVVQFILFILCGYQDTIHGHLSGIDTH